MITNEEKAERHYGIGGTDVAKICGAYPATSFWKTAPVTPADVWREKKVKERSGCTKKIIDTFDATASGHQKMKAAAGNACEVFVCEQFSNDYPQYELLEATRSVHPKYPHFFCNVDRFLLENGKKVGILEAKLATTYQSQKSWTTLQPYQLYQVAWQAYICDLPFVIIAVGNFHSPKQTYHVYERNAEFERQIVEKCHHFWDEYVVKDICPPDLEGCEIPVLTIPQSTILVDEDMLDLIDIYKHNKDIIKECEEKMEPVKERIIELMGFHELLVDNDEKVLISYKSQTRNTFDAAKFKKDYPELHRQYITQKTDTRTFSFKV